ncbi:metallophosphoesterase [Aquisalimonas lutea]|uniref:metallophosphoesterase family protein n=1 Tax=Aquisalimonas lutea TaxID=1327750 RepID=UPI0025B2DBFC|nr:metallophosphoesterase [Aquisalimonas lutea]MDN3517263.1 metallophosphoesterase [Aquisalimonas lutea]
MDDTALQAIAFAGDPHGVFGPLNQVATADRPPAMILIGDYDLDRPLDEAVAPAAAATTVYWIHGNHDVDQERYYTNLVDSGLAERCLHARVVDVAGVRIAGLGGHFQGRIWHPHEGDGQPRFAKRRDYLHKLAPRERWRGSLPLKNRAAIWWEDVEALWDERADVLVTHEAPACHPLGFHIFDELAEAMGARVIIHGHHHVAYRWDAADGSRTVIGLGLAGVSNGAGRIRALGREDYHGARELGRRNRQRLERPAGTYQTVEALLQEDAIR